MRNKILLIICLTGSQLTGFCQNPRLILNTTNAPLYTLFSPMSFARNSVTSSTVPSLTQASSGNTLVLTNQNSCEGVAATFNNTFNPSKDWQLKFTYTLTTAGGAASNADGIAVSIHNDARGVNAVGGSGSSLGCDKAENSFCNDNSTAIRRAMDWQFEIYSGAGTNGATLKTTTNFPVITTLSGPSSISPAAVSTNVPIDITMRYVASTSSLSVTLNDGTNTKTFSYIVNLSLVVGSSGYLAFTGSTGGATSGQTITKVFMLGYNN